MNEPTNNTPRTLADLRTDEQGLTTVEYVIILFLIAVAAIGVWQTFGETVEGRVTNATGQIEGLRGGG